MDRVAALCLAKTSKMKLLDSQWWTGFDDEASRATFACIWCLCSPDVPPQLDPWPGKTTIEPRALHSKELCLLAYVLATTCTGNPASVCKAVEHFGEWVLASSGLFLKVAGGSKAQVLTVAVRRAPLRGTIVEIRTH